MKQFGEACDHECTPTEKPSEGGPITAGRENLAVDECCGGTLDGCCEEEDEPAKQRWWGRYLERIKKATGGQPPKCH